MTGPSISVGSPYSAAGPTGRAATVDAGTTTTGAPGTDAEVVNSGSLYAAILDFTIPRGDPGLDGSDGVNPTVTAGTTTTGAPGSAASVVNSGTSTAMVLDFTIPRGADGFIGKTVLTGSGVPSSGTGTDGDSYIDTTNWLIYSPKAAGAWPTGHVLDGVDVIHHGASTSVARPNAKIVYWIGTATPANALAWDPWLKENI